MREIERADGKWPCDLLSWETPGKIWVVVAATFCLAVHPDAFQTSVEVLHG